MELSSIKLLLAVLSCFTAPVAIHSNTNKLCVSLFIKVSLVFGY
jgi:hypothetical protein